MDELSIHIKNFNDRVKAMNQTHSRELTMSAQDARNLHADIFAVLALITELSNRLASQTDQSVVEVVMDGGNFK